MTAAFPLAERYGRLLTGRTLATRVRSEIAVELAAGKQVVIDLDGVRTMSPSFADELFAKLAGEVRSGRVCFTHLNGHLETVARASKLARHEL